MLNRNSVAELNRNEKIHTTNIAENCLTADMHALKLIKCWLKHNTLTQNEISL